MYTALTLTLTRTLALCLILTLTLTLHIISYLISKFLSHINPGLAPIGGYRYHPIISFLTHTYTCTLFANT